MSNNTQPSTPNSGSLPPPSFLGRSSSNLFKRGAFQEGANQPRSIFYETQLDAHNWFLMADSSYIHCFSRSCGLKIVASQGFPSYGRLLFGSSVRLVIMVHNQGSVLLGRPYFENSIPLVRFIIFWLASIRKQYSSCNNGYLTRDRTSWLNLL